MTAFRENIGGGIGIENEWPPPESNYFSLRALRVLRGEKYF